MMDEIPLEQALQTPGGDQETFDGRNIPVALKFERASKIALGHASHYLLKGLIHPGDLSVWYGPSGCGKTFIVLHVAHAISVGRSVFGRRVKPTRVMLFALEGSSGFAKRAQAIQDAFGPASDLIVFRGALPLLNSPRLPEQIITAIRQLDVGLVIFDTLSRSMPGADENGPTDMTKMVGIFDRIRHETGAHVLVVHHTGKDEERGGRGHSSLRAAADVEIQVSRDKTGVRFLHVTKGRDEADGQTYGFILKVIDMGEDEDGDPVTTCIVDESCETPRVVETSKLNRGDMEAFAWLKEAIVEHGEAPHPNHPSTISAVVTKSAWMDVARKRTVESSDDALRKQIARATTNLTLAHRISVSAPYVWLL